MCIRDSARVCTCDIFARCHYALLNILDVNIIVNNNICQELTLILHQELDYGIVNIVGYSYEFFNSCGGAVAIKTHVDGAMFVPVNVY